MTRFTISLVPATRPPGFRQLSGEPRPLARNISLAGLAQASPIFFLILAPLFTRWAVPPPVPPHYITSHLVLPLKPIPSPRASIAAPVNFPRRPARGLAHAPTPRAAAPRSLADPEPRIREPNPGDQDFRRSIPYFAAIYRQHGASSAEPLFVADGGEYLRALALLGVSIAFAPHDVEERRQAMLWSPGAAGWKFNQTIPPDRVLRELQAPLLVDALRVVVADAASMYQVKSEDIRAWAVYDSATWHALCGRALSARTEQGIDPNKPALLRYRVAGGEVRVEVQ